MNYTINLTIVVVALAVILSQQLHRYPVLPLNKGAVVISGASSGLGKDLALRLCSASIDAVVFAGVRGIEDGERLKIDAVRAGCKENNLKPLMLDVAIESSVNASTKLVQSVLEASDLKLIGIVNNAGIAYRASISDLDIDNVKAMYDVNLFGVMRLTTAFLPLLATKGGRIVNTGSVAGLVGLPKWCPYADSKRALESVTDSWRRELQPKGISVSILEPGFVKSELCTRPICTGDPSSTTTPAFVHALTSAYPRARYAVANTGVGPAWLVSFLFWVLPDRILDALLAMMHYD